MHVEPVISSHPNVGMLNLFGSCLDNMIHHLEQQIKTSPVVDMKPVFQCLTLDIISKCAFGLESNTNVNPEGSQLYKMAKELGMDTRIVDFKQALLLHFFTAVKGKSPAVCVFPLPSFSLTDF